MDALLSATRYGGQIMLMGNELGEVKEGYLADLLLVDGDPLADLSILLDKTRLLAIMKDGVFHKAPEIAASRSTRSPSFLPQFLPPRLDADIAHRRLERARAAPACLSIWGLIDNTRLFLVTVLNGLTLASLYFIVASGFTLVFGLMRNVNLAHGSLYLLGGYVGYRGGEHRLVDPGVGGRFPDRCHLGLADPDGDPASHAGSGLAADDGHDRVIDLIADLLLWGFTAEVHQMEAPAWLKGPIRGIPIINAYSAYRMSLLVLGVVIGVALWLFLNRTRVGMMIRAGVDDRAMLAASGVNVNLVFAITFAIGAGLAGLGGVIGAVELSMVPGEDTRFLLASLIVVIVGGMGSVVGAAIGAAMLGLAETFGLAYAPTYSVVFTFVILVIVLAFRPRGLIGRPA